MDKLMKTVCQDQSSQAKKVEPLRAGLSRLLNKLNIASAQQCIGVFEIHIAPLRSNLCEWGKFWQLISNYMSLLQ